MLLARFLIHHVVPFHVNTEATTYLLKSLSARTMSHIMKTNLFPLLTLFLFLQDFLDNLLLLNQKSSDDTIANASTASRPTIRSLNCLLWLRNLGILARSQCRNLEMMFRQPEILQNI